jgi:hypothetical protein
MDLWLLAVGPFFVSCRGLVVVGILSGGTGLKPDMCEIILLVVIFWLLRGFAMGDIRIFGIRLSDYQNCQLPVTKT